MIGSVVINKGAFEHRHSRKIRKLFLRFYKKIAQIVYFGFSYTAIKCICPLDVLRDTIRTKVHTKLSIFKEHTTVFETQYQIYLTNRCVQIHICTKRQNSIRWQLETPFFQRIQKSNFNKKFKFRYWLNAIHSPNVKPPKFDTI